MRFRVSSCFILFLLIFSVSCRPLKNSNMQDIYRDDKATNVGGNDRRHQATADEILWTVHLTGCSGLLLSPDYVLTAAHCGAKVGDKIRSGSSVQSLGTVDLEITRVAEASVELDYSILGVRWLSSVPPSLPYPPRIATTPEDLFVSGNSEEGDELFTVGFPDDRVGIWPSTFAQGQAKAVNGNQLLFNIGVINGSSGSGVLKKETHMLVSLANGGPHSLGQAGWDKADKNDPKAWNYGTPLWSIFAQSKLLPTLFPGGANAYYSGTFQPKTRIFVAASGTGNLSKLWLAASDQTRELLICPGLVNDCSKTKNGTVTATRQRSSGGRAFYQSPVSPESLANMTLIALDKDGIMIGQRQVIVQKGI